MSYFLTASASSSYIINSFDITGSLLTSSIIIDNNPINIDSVTSVKKVSSLIPNLTTKIYKDAIEFKYCNDAVYWLYNNTSSRDQDFNFIKTFNSNYSPNIASPGGKTYSIQFNNNGYFDGNDKLSFDSSTNKLSLTGSANISGSLNVSGSFYINNNRQFNYGAFSDNTDQSGSAGVSSSMKCNTTDVYDGVSIVSQSRLTVPSTGIYNIQFSAQLFATSGADTVYIWLKKNGTNISNTATSIYLRNNEQNVAAWNWVYPLSSSDYVEIAWQSLNGNAILEHFAASGNIPSIPSVIITVSQVA